VIIIADTGPILHLFWIEASSWALPAEPILVVREVWEEIEQHAPEALQDSRLVRRDPRGTPGRVPIPPSEMKLHETARIDLLAPARAILASGCWDQIDPTSWINSRGSAGQELIRCVGIFRVPKLE
jgi:hypothetical protein